MSKKPAQQQQPTTDVRSYCDFEDEASQQQQQHQEILGAALRNRQYNLTSGFGDGGAQRPVMFGSFDAPIWLGNEDDALAGFGLGLAPNNPSAHYEAAGMLGSKPWPNGMGYSQVSNYQQSSSQAQAQAHAQANYNSQFQGLMGSYHQHQAPSYQLPTAQASYNPQTQGIGYHQQQQQQQQAQKKAIQAQKLYQQQQQAVVASSYQQQQQQQPVQGSAYNVNAQSLQGIKYPQSVQGASYQQLGQAICNEQLPQEMIKYKVNVDATKQKGTTESNTFFSTPLFPVKDNSYFSRSLFSTDHTFFSQPLFTAKEIGAGRNRSMSSSTNNAVLGINRKGASHPQVQEMARNQLMVGQGGGYYDEASQNMYAGYQSLTSKGQDMGRINEFHNILPNFNKGQELGKIELPSAPKPLPIGHKPAAGSYNKVMSGMGKLRIDDGGESSGTISRSRSGATSASGEAFEFPAHLINMEEFL